MLRLKLATDPRWADIAESNLEEILTDHAYCEQKAASSAISIIIQYPEYSELVGKMSEIAIEEMDHFCRVHQIIIQRGYTLGRDRKDDYVAKLFLFFKSSHDRRINLINKLLLSAMIEARSCERFRLLSKKLKDQELSDFYHELEQSEASHYTLFLNFAKHYGEGFIDVEQRWEEFLKYEAEIIAGLGNTEKIHG